MAFMGFRRNGSLSPPNALSMTAPAKPDGAIGTSSAADLEEALRIGRDTVAATTP
jgi:hypothetical protein